MGIFHITLSVHKEKNDKPIFCKSDGHRFNQERTLKLAADCNYRLQVNFRPPKKLQAMTLMEQGLVVIDISHTTEDKESSAYSAHFSPHVSPTKNGSRDTIPLTLTIEDGYELSTNLQGKWYKPTSTQHCDWGTIVHGIEYDCSFDNQDHTIKIIKCRIQ